MSRLPPRLVRSALHRIKNENQRNKTESGSDTFLREGFGDRGSEHVVCSRSRAGIRVGPLQRVELVRLTFEISGYFRLNSGHFVGNMQTLTRTTYLSYLVVYDAFDLHPPFIPKMRPTSAKTGLLTTIKRTKTDDCLGPTPNETRTRIGPTPNEVKNNDCKDITVRLRSKSADRQTVRRRQRSSLLALLV